MVMVTLYARQQKRHRCIEQSVELCGRGRGWDSVSQNKFIFLPWNIFCSVLFSDTDLPKIIVLAFVRDEFHCVLPPHLTRKEEAEGWSRQALSPWLTHLLSGPVCTWPPRNSKHTPNPFVTAHN